MSAPEEPEGISKNVIYGAQFQVMRISVLQAGRMGVGLRVRAEGQEFIFGVTPETARAIAGSLLKAADLADSPTN